MLSKGVNEKNSFYNITLSVRFGWRGREGNLSRTASELSSNNLLV